MILSSALCEGYKEQRRHVVKHLDFLVQNEWQFAVDLAVVEG